MQKHWITIWSTAINHVALSLLAADAWSSNLSACWKGYLRDLRPSTVFYLDLPTLYSDVNGQEVLETWKRPESCGIKLHRC